MKKIHLTPAAAVTAAVAFLAVGGLTTAAVAASNQEPAREAGSSSPAPAQTPPVSGPTQIQSPVQPLAPGQVKYVHRIWGDPKTELGVGVWAPSDWRMVKLSDFEAQFTSPNKLWLLRVNGITTDELPLETATNKKLAVLQATPGFKLISRTTSTTKATSEVFIGMTFRHTTLTYTYTDPTRGTRQVVDRLVVIGGSPGAGFEISAAGRPEDLAGLTAITAKATEDYFRLP